MGQYSGQGMATYSKILQSVRENGQAAGPQHQMHDKQLKEWMGRHPEAENVRAKIESKQNKISKETATKLKQQVTQVTAVTKEAIEATKKAVASVKVSVIPTEQETKEILKREAMKKIAESMRPHCRLEHIKSVGNGL